MKKILLFFAMVALLAIPAMASTSVDDVTAHAGDIALAAVALVATAVAVRQFGAKMVGLTLATVITTTDLQAAYGTQYANGSKGLKDLRTKMFESAEFDKLFNVEYTTLTTWEKATSSTSSFTQRFQLDYTPNGTVTFAPSKYNLDEVKVDAKFSSHEIKREFIGFMHSTGVDQNNQEFVKYVIDLISKQHVEDVELYGAWGGVNATITPGTATAASGMMDGFRKVINDGITAGTITPIAVGALPTTPSTMVEYIEEFVKSIPNTDKMTPMKLAMNLDAEELFIEGMRVKYNTYYRENENPRRVYVRKNIEVVGQRAMGDAQKIFCTPTDNLYKVVNIGASRMPSYNWETEDRKIKVWMDYLLKYCIWQHGRFYTNDASLQAVES